MRCDVAAVRLVLLSWCCSALSLSAQQPAGATRSSAAFDSLLAGMSCKQQKSGRMDCDFRAGGTRFVIAGVGQQDVSVAFLQGDTASLYVVSVAPLHGCVVVKPTRAADATRAAGLQPGDSVSTFAFVSPRTGKVYRTWQTCLSATRSDARATDDTAALKGDANADAKADSAKPTAPRPTTKKPATDAKASAPAAKPPV